MKTITVTDFRRNASSLITEVAHGEPIVLLRYGKPIAEVIPFRDKNHPLPSWKQSYTRLALNGSDLSSVILAEREL